MLVVLAAQSPAGRADLVAAVVGPDGAVKSKQAIHSMAGGSPGHILPVTAWWDGAQYLVLANIEPAPFAAAYDPFLLRVTRAGALAGQPAPVSREEESDDRGIDLASNGRELLVMTGHAAIPVDGATLLPRTPPANLGRTLTAQEGLAVEAGNGGYLAAWYETDADGTTVRASRIDAAGNYLDGDGILLGTLEPPAPHQERAIAIDGRGPHWLVVWSSGAPLDRIAARSVSWSGVAGEAEKTIGAGDRADVVWRGSHYALLRAGEDLELDILRPDGMVADTRVLVRAETVESPYNTTHTYAADPRLALLRDRLVALYSMKTITCGFFPGCGDRTEITGLSLDAPDAAPFVIDGSNDTRGLRDAATGGERALVVWVADQSLYGAFLSADAPEQAGPRFRIEPYGPPAAALAHDGADFIAAWTDRSAWPAESIATRRITSGGAVSDRTVLRLDDGEFASHPAVAASPALPALFAFSLHHSAYETVSRGALLFAGELAAAAAPPPAPAIACASENPDGTLTVRWQPAAGALGHAIELQLPDGTFRQVGVAAAGAARARVSRAGLAGSVVRVRAWNERGLSQPSAIAPALPAPQATLRSGTRACAGKPVTISYSLSGSAPFTVRWSDGVVQTNLQASAARTVTVLRDTTLSIVSVSDASCATGETAHSIRILVDPAAKIDAQPHEMRVTRGQTATLTVQADDDLTFAWFEGDPGDTSRPVGRNAPSFTTPALDVTARYWVRVSNRCGSVDSAVMVVVVTGGKGRAVRS